MSESTEMLRAKFLSANEQYGYVTSQIASSAVGGFLPNDKEITEFNTLQAKKNNALDAWIDADNLEHDAKMNQARERAV